ncbi:hypothetical protein DPMN_119953 [Dreissena polymorpha]|uniref:Uncharacterized protein n=1 Tax=Dreissena polymorpha TaxID=45954 RepID=A0A9D4JN62_DREPO|nr:hypothetical protein DPMN_119953 [Dreissena polymorpha]
MLSKTSLSVCALAFAFAVVYGSDKAKVEVKCPKDLIPDCIDPDADCPGDSHPIKGVCPLVFWCCSGGACACTDDPSNCDKVPPKL